MKQYFIPNLSFKTIKEIRDKYINRCKLEQSKKQTREFVFFKDYLSIFDEVYQSIVDENEKNKYLFSKFKNSQMILNNPYRVNLYWIDTNIIVFDDNVYLEEILTTNYFEMKKVILDKQYETENVVFKTDLSANIDFFNIVINKQYIPTNEERLNQAIINSMLIYYKNSSYYEKMKLKTKDFSQYIELRNKLANKLNIKPDGLNQKQNISHIPNNDSRNEQFNIRSR